MTSPTQGTTPVTALPAKVGPFLFVDLHEADRGLHPDWAALKADPRFVGVWLKAWDGVRYNDLGFLKDNWEELRTKGFIRGAYLYLHAAEDGALQAQRFLAAVADAGGFKPGDMRPVIDMERSGNDGVSKADVVTCMAAAADAIRKVTGSKPIVYGRNTFQELEITEDCGCDGNINPCYTPDLHADSHHSPKQWPMILWQYCGDGEGYLQPKTKYPTQAPGLGGVDISCYPYGETQADYDKMLGSLCLR